MAVHLVCDSNAQLPPEIVEREAVRVVPLPIVIDGVEHREGVDLDVDDFYARLASGAEVTTSQPSPGDFFEAYAAAVEDGATEIVSIHVGSAMSGTCNSARLGAGLASDRFGVDVHVVDSGLASFSIACTLLAAADARRAGADAVGMVAAAERLSDQVHNVFVTGGLELAVASGRVDMASVEAVAGDGTPVLSFIGGALDVLAHVEDLAAAADVMATKIAQSPGRLRVGVGVGDAAVLAFNDLLEAALAEHARKRAEVIRYRCGPSVGAFTGSGTAGACWVSLG